MEVSGLVVYALNAPKKADNSSKFDNKSQIWPIFDKASKINEITHLETQFAGQNFEDEVFRNCLNCLKQLFLSENKTIL